MAILTPGQYIAKRRAAAGLSIADVAAEIGTDPRLGEIDRTAWLNRIEADVAPVTLDVFAALHDCFPMDPTALQRLIDLRDLPNDYAEAPRLCRICACSEFDPCVADHMNFCGWAGHDLCTACAPAAAEAA